MEYDHEARDSYAVEVEAADARGGTARIAVLIAVLDVEEPPDKTGTPSLSAFGSTGLRVTWTAPSNEGPAISGYDVEYRARGTEAYLDAEHEGTATRATITGLARETLYEVRVRALNDEGTGAWSDTARAGRQAVAEEAAAEVRPHRHRHRRRRHRRRRPRRMRLPSSPVRRASRCLRTRCGLAG